MYCHKDSQLNNFSSCIKKNNNNFSSNLVYMYTHSTHLFLSHIYTSCQTFIRKSFRNHSQKSETLWFDFLRAILGSVLFFCEEENIYKLFKKQWFYIFICMYNYICTFSWWENLAAGGWFWFWFCVWHLEASFCLLLSKAWLWFWW